MKMKGVLTIALSVSMGVALLTGCGGSSPAAKDSADAAMQALIQQA